MKLRLLYFLFAICLFSASLDAQELFPITEPASTLPKNVLGLRLTVETYKEVGRSRNQYSLRFMYGIGPKFSLYIEPCISNHHDTITPENLAMHTHVGNQVIYSTSNKVFGLDYPYLFSGLYAYAKYRLYSDDGQNTHFRIALYAEGSTADVAHDEAEPNLAGDTKGVGGGVIVTELRNRIAANFTGGVIVPGAFHEKYHTILYQPPELTTDIFYRPAYVYDLSFGYLLFPLHYHDYSQVNVNLYFEFIGRSYTAAKVFRNGENLEITNATLSGGHYIDGCFGLQEIFDSNTRVDLTVTTNLVGRSWIHFYPMFIINLQQYFYLHKRTVITEP